MQAIRPPELPQDPKVIACQHGQTDKAIINLAPLNEKTPIVHMVRIICATNNPSLDGYFKKSACFPSAETSCYRVARCWASAARQGFVYMHSGPKNEHQTKRYSPAGN